MTRRASVRLRITAVATVGIGLALGATALWLAGRAADRQLHDVDAQLRSDAEVTKRFIRSGGPVPDFGPTGRIVQVVTPADGKVVGTNEDGRGVARLLPPPYERDRAVTVTVSADAERAGLGRVRVWATSLRAGEGDGTVLWVVVGRSVDELRQSNESLRATLLVVVPLLTLGLGALIWVVVGRSLRPVEVIRSTVSEITVRDLSQRVATTGSGDEVDRLAVTMNEMLARLERASERARRLVADASHELRSPLAAARALIQSRPDDPEGGRVHDAMALDALARLQALVDQLLELARQDLPHAPPSRPVDLDELVLQHADVLRRTSDLTVDTSSVSGGQVLGSEEALGRMVENLASNAGRHARSRVAFAVCEQGDRVELVVTDDGPGIDAEHREAVFERFTRLDDARARDGSGAGLGLAIVARIVERHQGTVTLTAAPPHATATAPGTTVTVRLPALPAVAADRR
jgi:signal transduction histidine kinase